MPSGHPAPGAAPRAAVLADSDSRWKWAALVARRLVPDHALDARFLHGATTPSAEQIQDVGVVPDTSATGNCADLLADPALRTADVLILGTTGGTILTALHHLAATAERNGGHRPIVVTGYVGVVYENLVDGLLLRAGSDLVLANSADDAARFRDVYRGIGADPASVVETSLPFLGGAPHDPAAAGRDRPFTVCFAVQPSVPATRGTRLALLDSLARHARRHPDREVLVKLRSRPGETATHADRHPYDGLLRSLPDPPANLRTVHGDMGAVLDRTDLLVTVSSTAALEALHRGVPTAVLSDYGVREAHGNHFFVRSGLLTSWAALDRGEVPVADPDWLARNGLAGSAGAGEGPARDAYAAARHRIAALRLAGPLPPPRLFYTAERGGPYLEQLLARRGVALSGEALPTTARHPVGSLAGARGLGAPLRRLRQRGAGLLYRVGRTRVAPVVRRWQQG